MWLSKPVSVLPRRPVGLSPTRDRSADRTCSGLESASTRCDSGHRRSSSSQVLPRAVISSYQALSTLNTSDFLSIPSTGPCEAPIDASRTSPMRRVIWKTSVSDEGRSGGPRWPSDGTAVRCFGFRDRPWETGHGSHLSTLRCCMPAMAVRGVAGIAARALRGSML